MKVIPFISPFIMLLFSPLSFANNNNVEIQTFIQNRYNYINPEGNHAICYFVGDVRYPYLAEPVEYAFRPGINQNETNSIKVRLDAFVKAGLLEERPAAQGKDGLLYPLYALTQQADSFAFKNTDELANGKVIHESYFCFGRIVIDKINQVKEVQSTKNSTEMQIEFQYHLENIPEWAKNPALAIYGEKIHIDPNYRYTKEIYLTKREGQYYNQGAGPKIRIERKAYLQM